MASFVKSFFSATAWSVFLMIFTTSGLMVLQMFTDVKLPHTTSAWLLVVVASGYTGTDRLAHFIKTKQLSFGQGDFGDIKKLRRVQLLLFLVFVQSLYLGVIQKVPGMAIEELLMAFGTTAAMYTIGNKAVRSAEAMSGSMSLSPEKPQGVSPEPVTSGAPPADQL